MPGDTLAESGDLQVFFVLGVTVQGISVRERGSKPCIIGSVEIEYIRSHLEPDHPGNYPVQFLQFGDVTGTNVFFHVIPVFPDYDMYQHFTFGSRITNRTAFSGGTAIRFHSSSLSHHCFVTV